MPGSQPLSEPNVEKSSFILLGDLSYSSKWFSEPSQYVYFQNFCGLFCVTRQARLATHPKAWRKVQYIHLKQLKDFWCKAISVYT